MAKKKSFWIGLCFINLCIVALLGFTLRSKILFSIPFIDYRNVLSAHSHFAFAGWAGLSLMTLLIFEVLPQQSAERKIYTLLLWGIEISSLGMAILFPVQGYAPLSIFFSSLYIVVTFVFAPVFCKDLLRQNTNKSVKLLGVSAMVCLVVSAIGPLGLSYILISKSGNSLLYRDSIYTFLHFQYNGFFTLSVFALFFNFLAKKNADIGKPAQKFSFYLCLSILPALFLSLLWYNYAAFYVLAAIGCILILISLFWFFKLLPSIKNSGNFLQPAAYLLWTLSAFSFALKMLLNVGTIFPALGNAVYGDRPVIIGFLHLVFLGFLTFYILSQVIEKGFFTKERKTIIYPFIVFAFGIIANETILMIQGLGVLFKTNHSIFNWLLWSASIVLFLGAFLITIVRFRLGTKYIN